MQQRLRKFSRDPEHLPKRLITERSLKIISLINEYHFLPTSLIIRLIPGNQRITQRHLQTLYHKGFINRFAFPKVGAGFVGEFVYYLDSAYALELLVEAGADSEVLSWDKVRNNREKKYCDILDASLSDDMQGQLLFLNHELMISRFHALLQTACNNSNGQVVLENWKQGSSLWSSVSMPAFSYDERKFQEYDKKETVPVRPDGFFTLFFPLQSEEKQRKHFFYEADRNRSSVSRMVKKLRAYYHFLVKQRKQEQVYGISDVKAVLVETIDNDSASALRGAAQKPVVSGLEPSPLFWFTSSSFFTKKQQVADSESVRQLPLYLLKPDVIFKKIWLTVVSNTLYSLID